MKIKTTKSHRFGRTCTTSAGDVTFNEEGIAEIEDSRFEAVSAVLKDVEKVEGAYKKEAKKQEPSGKDEAETPGSDSGSDAADKIDQLPVEELRELALMIEGAEKKKISKMGKEALIEFIKSNQG